MSFASATACAADATVQGLVVNASSTDETVQALMLASPFIQAYIAQLEQAVQLAVTAAATKTCNAGLEELYFIDAEVGGASILTGIAWPAVALGLIVSVWRMSTASSVRSALLLAVMILTIADVAVISWARSTDLRIVYIEHVFLYGKLLIVFSVGRNALLLIASCLRFRVVLRSKFHQDLLLATGSVIALGSMTASYALGFTSLQASGAQSVSRVFWGTTCIIPVTYSVFGLATFTLQLRRNRFGSQAISASTSSSSRMMANLEVVNTALMILTTSTCILVLVAVFVLGDGSNSYYPAPLEIAACAYWCAGENLFEIVARFKTNAETGVINLQDLSGGSLSAKQMVEMERKLSAIEERNGRAKGEL
ncbi:hypothetical protein HKX48_007129 [Thoreauomyces humboldtii]|nr:hypothetical protein HKX48_007129 [Thoreauomyces humboldtii]